MAKKEINIKLLAEELLRQIENANTHKEKVTIIQNIIINLCKKD